MLRPPSRPTASEDSRDLMVHGRLVGRHVALAVEAFDGPLALERQAVIPSSSLVTSVGRPEARAAHAVPPPPGHRFCAPGVRTCAPDA
jgi:hypothetical protein